MRWIYGKQDFSTIERGQENCYLLTNGLGGFSSLTMTGSAARNDHALLMACIQAPNHRYNMVHRLAETLAIGKDEFILPLRNLQMEQKRRDIGIFLHLSMMIARFGNSMCRE